MSSTPELRWWQRYTTELIVVAVGLAVVVGLWVRNRPDDRPATSTPEVTTTVAPSTTSASEGEAPGDEAVDPVAGGDEAASLARAVLRIDDLPAGWSPVEVGGDTVAGLCEDRNAFASVAPAGSARSAFRRGTSGEAISGTVARFADDDRASSLLDRIREDARACTGGAATYSVASLGGVGDEGLKISISVPVGGRPLRTLVTVARDDEHVAVVSVTGQPDEALAVRALRAELGRL